MSRARSFINKEFLHIIRDPRTMMILLLMPVAQVIIFGFAISTEVKNSRVAIYDPSSNITSAEIKQKISASEYFTVAQNISSPNEVDQLFRQSKIDLAVIFDQNFSTNGAVQIITDASDPNSATITTGYMTAIIHSVLPQESPITTDVSYLYNPSMKSSYNFVPGVMGLILMLICAMMTSIAIVREKERGTMEVLLVSPLHPLVIIIAKVIPYFVLSIINLSTILFLAVFVLGVPISGSFFWLFLFSQIFILVALSLGLLISTLVKSQVAAIMTSSMVLMMPTIVLSGMMFPVENMPVILQGMTYIVPARWYIEGVRKLMIQGVEVQYVLKEFLVLGIMAVVLITISLKRFKIRL